jgi:lysozyme family protein
MAEFIPALKEVLGEEGTYSNHPEDNGGETYMGIARRKHSNWAGWGIVDGHRGNKNFPAVLDTIPQLHKMAWEFYTENGFWKYDNLASQQVATKLLDIGVNMGPRWAVLTAQAAVGTTVDGLWGPTTLKALNAAPEAKLMQELRARQALRYAKMGKNDIEAFGLGWMRRAVK